MFKFQAPRVILKSWLSGCCFIETQTNVNVNKCVQLITHFSFLSAVRFWVLFYLNNFTVVREAAENYIVISHWAPNWAEWKVVGRFLMQLEVFMISGFETGLFPNSSLEKTLLSCRGIISGVIELQLCYWEHLAAPKKIYPGAVTIKTTSRVNYDQWSGNWGTNLI